MEHFYAINNQASKYFQIWTVAQIILSTGMGTACNFDTFISAFFKVQFNTKRAVEIKK